MGGVEVPPEELKGETFPVTDKTRLARLPTRGSHEKEKIHAILQEGFLCHVAFKDDNGEVRCIPTAYGIEGDYMILHAKSNSFMLRQILEEPCCVVVTLCDGFVMARSVFNHSFNYRSVVLFGKAEEITDPDEKMRSMHVFTDHVIPNRWAEARVPTDAEVSATIMARLPISEASAKCRTGNPGDDKCDDGFPVWSGVLPLYMATGEPINDPTLTPGTTVPEYVRNYKRPGQEKGAKMQREEGSGGSRLALVGVVAFLAGFAVRTLTGLLRAK
eukprot:comp20296_c0_seq2/m.25486 comp20296_c0_seq2/g.25486  ORF comp20296_c0_seq2/g.25486 comp20296_c0_seq2/m.25486 type:complete len:273 (-) comp20296_c0_seq2:52-870(-)